MRLANVNRGFGNKASWDRSFIEHFNTFAQEANHAVIDSGGQCKSSCEDVFSLKSQYDLVYIDPPYINRSGVGVDYRDFYHFLEGMVRRNDWSTMIDIKSKHRRLVRQKNDWCDPDLIHQQFQRLFEHFQDSILVVSYRSEGIPTIDGLVSLLEKVKRRVCILEGENYQYALSTNRRNKEVLLIATDS